MTAKKKTRIKAQVTSRIVGGLVKMEKMITIDCIRSSIIGCLLFFGHAMLCLFLFVGI